MVDIIYRKLSFKMWKIFCLAILVGFGCTCITAVASTYTGPANKRCADGNLRGLQYAFYGVPNRILLGQTYRNLTVASSVFCIKLCAITESQCFSFHYSDREKRCELNGATASRFPLAVEAEHGTDLMYYGPEEPHFVQVFVDATEKQGMPSLTDDWYQTHASAADECSGADQHLCFKWELQHANQQGYPVTTPLSLWYSNPDSQAKLTETGVTYHDSPLSLPARGLCCSRPLSYRDPIYTQSSYDVTDRDGMISDCSAQAAHLCTLAELKEAYIDGYRSSTWLQFSIPNRDARVLEGGCTSSYTGSECYEGLIANTPRPNPNTKGYCCPNRS